MSVEEMADFIRVDSLGFLSIDGLYRAVGEAGPRQRAAAILRRLLHRRNTRRDSPTIEGSDNVRTLSLLATGGQ